MTSSASLSPDFAALASMARSGGAGLAAATFRAQADLLALREPTAAEAAAALSLLMDLLPGVDEETARLAASRLAPLGRLPQPLAAAFLERGGAPAEMVAALTPRLDDDLRLKAALSEDPRLAAALAGRADLNDADQRALAARGETAAVHALARNTHILLLPDLADAFLVKARLDERLALLMLARADIDPVKLIPLYPLADARRRLLLREALADRMQARGMPRTARVVPEPVREALLAASLDGMAALIAETGLQAGRTSAFVALAARDASRDIMALALVDLGVTPEDAIRMLLRTGDPVALESRRLGQVVELLRETSAAAAAVLLGVLSPRAAEADQGEAQPARDASPDAATDDAAQQAVNERRAAGDVAPPAPGRAGARHVPVMDPSGTPQRAGSQRPQRRTPATGVVDALRSRAGE
jgi:hypothetical protein